MGASAIAAPNLFILGAGKCGTTSLHVALAEHPDIHMSAVKEPTFFACWRRWKGTAGDYFRLFETTRDVKYRGESSHAYLSDPDVAPILHRLFPDARLIVTFRDPARRAHSLYQHMRRHEPENIATFAAALAAEPERMRGDWSTLGHYPWNFFYAESSRYDVQLQRYVERFGRERLFVTTLAALTKRFADEYARLCLFLGIPVAPQAEFPRYNIAPDYPAIDRDSRELLAAALSGVTDRVDAMLGRRLDWSM